MNKARTLLLVTFLTPLMAIASESARFGAIIPYKYGDRPTDHALARPTIGMLEGGHLWKNLKQLEAALNSEQVRVSSVVGDSWESKTYPGSTNSLGIKIKIIPSEVADVRIEIHQPERKLGAPNIIDPFLYILRVTIPENIRAVNLFHRGRETEIKTIEYVEIGQRGETSYRILVQPWLKGTYKQH